MSITEFASEYRYYTTDLLSNSVLAEVPFKGVSYERAIKGAGKFSGSIPFIPETAQLDLYGSTMPGKTGLYIVRDGQCVWGGVIWSRSYNTGTRDMKVQASEFTSYLYHRNIWKTYTHDFSATIVATGGVAAVALVGNAYAFPVGSTIRIIFYEVGNFVYNGYYTVLASPAPTTTTCSVLIPLLPDGTYEDTTVYVRVDTYDYIRQLLDTMFVDYTNIDFPNDEINPGISTLIDITSVEISSGVATIVTAVAHGLIYGQEVEIVNTAASFVGKNEVASVPDATTFTYVTALGDITPTAMTPVVRTVTNKQLTSLVATLTTSVTHGFLVGDTIVVAGVDDSAAAFEVFNGTKTVATVPTAETFTYDTFGVVDVASLGSAGTATKSPGVYHTTYGPFPANSDIGFGYSDAGYSGKNVQNSTFRGYKLESVGEVLDKYSDTIDGFEYRIDCDYDAITRSFTRTFVMIPIDFPNPPAPGDVSPPSRFGADRLVFDFPGSIIDVQIDESAENAATRFFVVGSTGDLGEDASQPYAVATATDLLDLGWPLLDAEESIDSVNMTPTEASNSVDTTSEETLYKYAQRYLTEFRPPVADIAVTVNGSLSPKVGSYVPGDWCSLAINDDFVRERLASDLEPRDTILVRKIDSFSITVPDTPTFPETVTLNLITEWEVDKRG